MRRGHMTTGWARGHAYQPRAGGWDTKNAAGGTCDEGPAGGRPGRVAPRTYEGRGRARACDEGPAGGRPGRVWGSPGANMPRGPPHTTTRPACICV